MPSLVASHLHRDSASIARNPTTSITRALGPGNATKLVACKATAESKGRIQMVLLTPAQITIRYETVYNFQIIVQKTTTWTRLHQFP